MCIFNFKRRKRIQCNFSETLTLKDFMHCFGLELSSFNEEPIFGSQHGGQSPEKLVAWITCFQCFFPNLMLHHTAHVPELLVTQVTLVREVWDSISSSGPMVLKLRLAR